MKLTAQVYKADDWWVAEVPEIPALLARAQRLNSIVDALAAEYEKLSGCLPEPFLVALKVEGESWRMYRPYWPVRSKWNETWQTPVPLAGPEDEIRAWLETGTEQSWR